MELVEQIRFTIQKYNNSHYDRIELHVTKGKKELYKEYAKRKDKDLLKLAKYAKKLNIEKELVDVMEVLL